MKNGILIFTLAIFLSCTNDAATSANGADSASAGGKWEEEISGEQSPVAKEQFYVWEVDADKKTKQLNPQLQANYFNVDTLIMGLNERFPQVLLEKNRIGHDTLYAEIKQAEYLTERMGSLGAEHYIATAVLNLTSANGINYVHINFTEGSHASPDVWDRQSFAAYKEIAQQ